MDGGAGSGTRMPARPALHHDEQPREVDAQFAASLRAAMNVDVDDDCLARAPSWDAERASSCTAADQAATRRAVHAPHEPAPLAFAPRASAMERWPPSATAWWSRVYSAAEVDAIQKLLGRGRDAAHRPNVA